MSNSIIHLCLISDDNYVMPTCVALQSIIESKSDFSTYHIHIVASSLSNSVINKFKNFESDNVIIEITEDDAQKRFEGLHTFTENSICAASISALLKFVLPDLFPDLDKILYLDGDLIVKIPLENLYATDIKNYFAAAAIDSGSIYYKHAYVKMVKHYFNSGVMLLNLSKMRKENIIEKLIKTKQAMQDTSLMDQNVFNLVFDDKTFLLPIRYNFMPVSLDRSNSKWKIQQINETYGTNYSTKKELYSDAAIIHYSSKDKPWKVLDGACSAEWISVYLRTPITHTLIPSEDDNHNYKLSIIMPCYNVANYIRLTLESILYQTYNNYEIICIDDGSTDETLNILREYEAKYSFIKVFSHSNHGQGYERNFGIDVASGKYLYFMDSDDLLHRNCFKRLISHAEENRLDLLYFEGSSFYETTYLEEKFPQYKTTYNRKNPYPNIYSGEELYIKLRANGEMIVSPCLQLIKKDFLQEKNIRFPNLPVLEDNLYTFKTLIHAERAACIPDILFYRRVRNNSTMTSTCYLERTRALTYIIQETLKVYTQYDINSPMYQAISNHIRGYFKLLYNFYKEINMELPRLLSELSDAQWEFLLLSMFTESEEKRYRDLNAKLQKTYSEKSEINRKLQITYAEKAERGLKIKQLEADLRLYQENASIFRALKYKLLNILKKILQK